MSWQGVLGIAAACVAVVTGAVELLRDAGSLRSLVMSPLRVDVLDFYFDEVRNKPDDVLVVITPHPRCYRAELHITNRTGKTAFVRSVRLRHEDGRVYEAADLPDPWGIQPRQPARRDVVFPLNSDEEAAAGQFRLITTPTVGRKAIKRLTLSC